MNSCLAAFTLSTMMFTLIKADASASATYDFKCITNNNTLNAAAASQFKLEVSEVAGNANQILFTFKNLGSAASSITDVYFYDGYLLGTAAIVNATGVTFTSGATPASLPGYNGMTPGTVTYSADVKKPALGVNPGESFGIQFSLLNNQIYSDTLSALAQGIAGKPSTSALPSLMVGIHVQSFTDTNGGSESFILTKSESDVTTPTPTVPEPSSLMLTGIGLSCLLKKRKAR